jgi:arylformamidase
MDLIDISVALTSTMPVYPGEPGPELRPLKRLASGESSNLSALSMSLHNGTHLDAPWHKLESGARSDVLDPMTLCGPAAVILVDDPVSIRRDHLEHLAPAPERLLIRTRNSRLYSFGRFIDNYVYIHPSAAEWAVENRLRLIGIDYLSVEKFKEPGSPTHRALLGGGVTILEGIDLSGVSAGEYTLWCLPLKLPGADGVPARAALQRGSL